MKTFSLREMGISLKSYMIAFSTIALLGVSCQKESSFAENETLNRNAESRRNSAPKPGTESIATVAGENGLNELVKALSFVDEELETGLVKLFAEGKDQFTVFAPTDEAFEAAYDALGVTKVSEIDPEVLLQVLQYHVAEGRRAANSVVPTNGYRSISTLLPGATFSVGSNLMITAVGSTATITGPNKTASNGIIHIIDNVLLPIKL